MHTALEGTDPWLDDTPLQMRADVEVITGAGGRTMLVSGSGRFLAISGPGLAVLRRMDGSTTGTELLQTLKAEHPQQAERIDAIVPTFLADLRRAAVLTVEPLPAPRSLRDRFVGLGRLDPVKRLPLFREPGRRLRPVAELLRRLPRRLVVAAAVLLAVVAAVLATLALRRPAPSMPAGWQIALAAGVIVLEIALHESAHAVAMTALRLRIRDAGVGLLFGVLPMAYVDRTDSYRHPGRTGRALVSLAGPLVDVTLSCVSALLVLTAPAGPAAFFRVLLIMQLLSLATNLNPLFPTDGYHAIESACGAVNMRGRALTYVLHRLARRPLPQYLVRLPARTRWGYVLYMVVSVGYTALVLTVMTISVISLALRMAS